MMNAPALLVRPGRLTGEPGSRARTAAGRTGAGRTRGDSSGHRTPRSHWTAPGRGGTRPDQTTGAAATESRDHSGARPMTSETQGRARADRPPGSGTGAASITGQGRRDADRRPHPSPPRQDRGPGQTSQRTRMRRCTGWGRRDTARAGGGNERTVTGWWQVRSARLIGWERRAALTLKSFGATVQPLEQRRRVVCRGPPP